jgi:tripartite ATP-independent transporter DctP family solute receptor
VAFGVFAEGQKEGASGAKKTVIKFADTVAPDHPNHLAAEEFAKIVAEKSNGSIQVDTFPAAQLGNEKELLEGVMLGTIDIAMVSPGALSLFQSEFGILDCPYIFRSEEHMKKVVRGEIGDELSSLLEKSRGIQVLATDWLYGTRHLTTKNTPVKKPEDTEGLLIRAPEQPVYLATVASWGATPTPVDFSDLYMALKQGTVDGQENPIPTIYTYKYYEAQKYLIKTGHMIRTICIVTNAAWYNKMSDDVRSILEEAMIGATEFNNNLINQKEKELLEELKELGMEVIEPDVEAFREASSSVHKQFEDEWGKGLYERIQAVK